MKGAEYLKAIEKIGFRFKSDAAVFLGVDYTTARRWANDETTIPHATALLLRYMVKHGIPPEEVDDGRRAAPRARRQDSRRNREART